MNPRRSGGRFAVPAIRANAILPNAIPVLALSLAAAVGCGEPQASALVIAHRGASYYAPEHTLAAYDLALRQGADFLEQDLHLSADGELVVIHDATLDRTARGPAGSCTGEVADKALAQLRRCDVGRWFGEAFPDRADASFEGERIPTLREVIERYRGRTRFYIETKQPEAAPGMEQKLLALFDETGLSPDDVVIQSFSADSLRLIRQLDARLELVRLLGRRARALGAWFEPERVAEYADGVGPHFSDVDPAFVDAARAAGLAIHPYTVNEPAEMQRLLALGVGGIFTDAPDRLVSLLDR